jgi:hypothetical protein
MVNLMGTLFNVHCEGAEQSCSGKNWTKMTWKVIEEIMRRG